jgi:hypothetical protein
MQILHDPKQLAQMAFNEGIGYVPFSGIPYPTEWPLYRYDGGLNPKLYGCS